MRFASLLIRSVCALACLVLTACDPSGQSQADEEKEPHFLAGKSHVNTLDYEGAIECFEKALEANPQSGSAHFELAWLYDQKQNDPAAAIYHYQHYLQLRPGAGNAETVKQRILAAKQELARSVSLGPVTEKVQRDLDALTQETKRLTEENKKLKEDLETWKAYAARLQTLTNQTSLIAHGTPRLTSMTSGTSVYPVASSTNLARTNTSAGIAGRTHTVKAGETPTSIARKYGLRPETLMAANPRLDAKRLQVGQTLVIPAP